MPDTTHILALLFLVNVFQPITEDELRREYDQLVRSFAAAKPAYAGNFQEAVDLLLKNGSMRKRGDRYSLTAEGFRRIATAGIEKIRDKDRLFYLKNLLYK